MLKDRLNLIKHKLIDLTNKELQLNPDEVASYLYGNKNRIVYWTHTETYTCPDGSNVLHILYHKNNELYIKTYTYCWELGWDSAADSGRFDALDHYLDEIILNEKDSTKEPYDYSFYTYIPSYLPYVDSLLSILS